MAILFACPSTACAQHAEIVAFVADAPRHPECSCGAYLEPVDFLEHDPGRIADYVAVFEMRGG